jgi:hypothetical protein
MKAKAVMVSLRRASDCGVGMEGLDSGNFGERKMRTPPSISIYLGNEQGAWRIDVLLSLCMQWLRNLPSKFLLAFGIVRGLSLVQGYDAFFTFHGICLKSLELSEDAFPSKVHLTAARRAMSLMRSSSTCQAGERLARI